jgi:hypothetical protein
MPSVPAELCQILERANENTLTMLQEMLRAHEGQDFQMAFLGQQAVAQTILLAELNAMQSSAKFQDIKPIVQQAIAQTMRHLDRAKQLASQFEKDVKAEGSTNRPAGTTNGQPANGQPANGQPPNGQPANQ